MKTPSAELLELCGAVRDETATAEQIARLEIILGDDPDARRFYRQFTQISAMLERYEQLPAPSESLAAEAPATPKWRIGVRYCLAFAASLAVLTAVYFRFRTVEVDRANVMASPVLFVGLVQDSHQCTVIPRVGPAVALNESYLLKEGDIVATASQGKAVLRFGEESTLFILSGDTRLWLTREGRTKIVHLSSGEICADVASQKDGAQWRILTMDGEAKVLGTRLAVTALAGSTRVAVTSGLVRVTARDSRQSVETPAGFAAELTPTTARLIKLGPTEPTRVATFTLVDADTNQPIPGFESLRDGATIDLAALPTCRLNIRANCEPLQVGAVSFAVSAVDADNRTVTLLPPQAPQAVSPQWRDSFPNRVESFYPYMLAGDPSVDGQTLPDHSYPWTPPTGRYTMTATPYAIMKSSGARGTALTVHFEVTDSAAVK